MIDVNEAYKCDDSSFKNSLSKSLIQSVSRAFK